MFGTHCFDADMDECYKQCQTNCIEACEMLLSNKKIDTFLAKCWLFSVKTVKIMCHCSEYPEYSGSYVINNVNPTGTLKVVDCWKVYTGHCKTVDT